MGIRPQFHIVVGVDDAKKDDPRYTQVDDKEWLEELLNFRKLTEEECWKSDDGFFSDYRDTNREIYSLLYNPTFTDEFIVGNVIGLIVREGPHDDNIMRALASLDEKYMQSGWERIPTLEPSEHGMMFRHYKWTDEDVKANRFTTSVFENIPSISRMHWERAQHYLKMIGWDVQETDLRYLLVWDWS